MAIEKIYIIEVDTLESFECQLMPNSFSENVQIDINKIKTISRTNPFIGYSGTQETISFDLQMYSDEESRKELHRKINWIKGLAYPDKRDGKPSRLRIVWGELLNKYTFALQSCEIKKSNFSKYHDGYPSNVVIGLSFALDMDTNITKTLIRQ